MKKFIALLLSILVIFSLTACGNSASSDGFTKGSDWVEVKSIEYIVNDKSNKLYTTTINYDAYYIISKVLVRFLSDGSIEIKYSETSDNAFDNLSNFTARVLPTSYKIIYFN